MGMRGPGQYSTGLLHVDDPLHRALQIERLPAVPLYQSTRCKELLASPELARHQRLQFRILDHGHLERSDLLESAVEAVNENPQLRQVYPAGFLPDESLAAKKDERPDHERKRNHSQERQEPASPNPRTMDHAGFYHGHVHRAIP